MAAVRHLELNIIVLDHWLLSSSKYAFGYQISLKLAGFSLRWRFSKWGIFAILNFGGLIMGSLKSTCMIP